jgi:hypothetical protein
LTTRVNHDNLASYWLLPRTNLLITLDYVVQKQGFVKPPGDLMPNEDQRPVSMSDQLERGENKLATAHACGSGQQQTEHACNVSTEQSISFWKHENN